jgi:hypothetical protein
MNQVYEFKIFSVSSASQSLCTVTIPNEGSRPVTKLSVCHGNIHNFLKSRCPVYSERLCVRNISKISLTLFLLRNPNPCFALNQIIHLKMYVILNEYFPFILVDKGVTALTLVENVGNFAPGQALWKTRNVATRREMENYPVSLDIWYLI